MIQILKDALSSPAGSFGFVFSMLILGGWLIYFVTKKVTSINSEHGVISKSVEKIEKLIDDIRKDVSYLKGSIDILKSAGDLLKSHSPVSLTEKGILVAKEIKAEEIISRTWEKIYAILERDISQKNAYDIQQYCLEEISVEPERFFDTEGLNSLKNYAYKQGNTLQLYTRLMGVIVRDKYLEKKGISISDIDKFAPDTNKTV